MSGWKWGLWYNHTKNSAEFQKFVTHFHGEFGVHEEEEEDAEMAGEGGCLKFLKGPLIETNCPAVPNIIARVGKNHTGQLMLHIGPHVHLHTIGRVLMASPNEYG